MKSKAFRILIRPIILLFAVLIVAISSQSGFTRNQDPGPQVEASAYKAVITGYCQRSNAVLFHPGSGKIYASIPSGAYPNGNSIARVNPVTGVIERTAWIGSEPNKLALAADGHTIYVGIDGALSLRTYDAMTDTPGEQFGAGMTPLHGPMRILDFALSPVNSNVFALSRASAGPANVAVYDGAVQRASVGGAGQALSFTDSEATLYGIWNNPMQMMSVSAAGITGVTPMTSPPNGGRLSWFGDLLFTSNGDVFQAANGAMVTTLPRGASDTTNRPFAIDPASNRIFYVTKYYYRLRIDAFDLQTLTFVGSAQVDLPSDDSDPKSVARWGTNGIAVSMTKGPTQFIQSDLIGAGPILPPATAPTPSTQPQTTAYIRRLNFPNNDIIFNHRDQLLYVSVPTSANSPMRDTITRLDPATGAVISSTLIGPDPHRMALSADGETLYAALHASARVRRFDTVTQTPGLEFLVPNRFHQATGIAVLPDNPGSVAIATAEGGTYVFDNGIQRPNFIDTALSEVVNDGTPNVIYAAGGYGDSLVKLSVTPSGLSVISEARYMENVNMVFDNGRVYSGRGRVIDPATNRILGKFAASGINALTVEASKGRVLVTGSDGIVVYDMQTFNKIGSIALPDQDYDGYPTRAVRWGYNGLAISVPNYLGPSSITLVQSPLIAGTRPFDFDADGKTDVGIFRPAESGGEWWINRSSTGETFSLQFGASTDKIAPADYTGDGKADIAFFRPTTGEWYVIRSEDSSFFALPFGAEGDVPAPADYDADGRADFAVFRPASATWFISQSSGGPTRIEQFGVTGDQPVVADYDGDGKADVGIFRATAGGAEWWIQRSTAGSLALQFGANTDKAVQGDYTGDGKADVAIFRPSTGEWFIVRSEDSSFYGFAFGANGDVPAPGDYDGDGKFDATVFRPSSATWFIARSTAGTQIVQFGANGDLPIQASFLP